MESIREQFREGKEPIGCQLCWDEEEAGITSMRQHRFNISNHQRSAAKKFHNRLEDPKIVSLDFKFSSLCNLNCRICGPYCSSNWLKEALDTELYHEHTIKIFSSYADRKFVNNEKNFEVFKEAIPNLHLIEFYGGEPLMQPEHGKIMQILNDYPGIEDVQMDLYYNTNGTIYDELAIETWKKMRVVELNFSIDDVADRFEYQRYPAKWNEVLENITRYKENCSPNVSIQVYMTINLHNIFYLDEYLKFNADNLKSNIRFNLLHWPEKMAIKHLPKEIKEIIKTKLEFLNDNVTSYIDHDFFSLESLIHFMMSNDGNTEYITEFLASTKTHDDYRKQSFKNTFPEYWNLLNGNN
jgi:sulfatase maturation enzyme AslB (radical SAM superfamily)